MTTNSASGDITGSVTQIGTVHGDVHIGVGSSRDRYLHHVVAFAPAKLLDRDEELAELTDFCAAVSTAGPYVANQFWSARPVKSVADAYAQPDDHEHAEQIAHLITSAEQRAEALASLACLAVDVGERKLLNSNMRVRVGQLGCGSLSTMVKDSMRFRRVGRSAGSLAKDATSSA